MEIDFPEWDMDSYVMMPACAYNGNRYKRDNRPYPPMYKKDETGIDCDVLMTDVPALNPDGSGEIQVTSGDMATPCVGIYNREKKQGFLLFCEQEVKGKNIGFTLKAGKLAISYPASRTDFYRFWFFKSQHIEADKGIPVENGEEVSSKYKIVTFPCDSMACFYDNFFKLRKSVMSDERAPSLYTRELWDLMEKHFNEENYSGEYYAEVSKIWQCGWVGGGMSNYALLKLGNDISKERAIKTIDYMTSHQANSGFYYGRVENGEIQDDSNNTEGMENIHLLRKSADGLYFLFKNFSITEVKNEWKESAKRCADAFCKLFETYGRIGQFANVETGELVVGNSNSAAIVSAALAKAYEFFCEEKYLHFAKKILEYHYKMFEDTGVTNGGPGEIMGAPDSESAFGLLESCVILYEITKDEKWLKYAETVAKYCSSWVVTYSYKFPETSEFGRLGINTVGSVFANVQNKHSAPGICTLSGDSILKLYRYTKNEEYLELIKDIAYFIPQCVSTSERPILTWHNPQRILPPGFINERVNMSDWEGKDKIGGVFGLSCWPETSLILSFAELVGQEEFN
ncbi:MAG: AGE family epimerase/isomerase [Clostridia bacterium]|nr:AGE family epimerase/isomerase [Clostridia bacterium]